MPEIGEIRKGKEIGKTSPRSKYKWVACIDCGKLRWVDVIKNSSRCWVCNFKNRHGENSSNWKGGKRERDGYLGVRLQSNDFFYPMVSKGGYVLEHRLIVAKHFNRCLLPWEVVHHKNGIKIDNRLENLELLSSQKYHLNDAGLKATLKRLQTIIEKQHKAITILQQRLVEVQNIPSSLP